MRTKTRLVGTRRTHCVRVCCGYRETVPRGKSVLTSGCAGGDAMTWEWEHRNNRGQWVLTVGAWHAVVQRVAGARPTWQAALARTTAPHDRYATKRIPKP